MKRNPALPARVSLALAITLALGGVPLAASAATLTVTSGADPGSASTCTLRQAITAMNHGATTGADEGNCRAHASGLFGTDDTIVFDTDTFPAGDANVITLVGQDLSITRPNLVIDASANGQVVIDANHASRVMLYEGPNHPALRSVSPQGALTAPLVLKHLGLRNGDARDFECGGGISGGGLCALGGDVKLVDCKVSGNRALSLGGGIFLSGGNQAELVRSTVSGNTAGLDGGGIAAQYGDVQITNSSVTDNVVGSSGGGVWIIGGSLTLSHSIVADNHADSDGGGIWADGPGSMTVNGGSLSGNTAVGAGGAVYSSTELTLSGVTIAGNEAYDGAGVYAEANVTISNSTIRNNRAGHYGGGLGVGLYAYADAVITNSTLYANHADSRGGGLSFGGFDLKLFNVTIVGNSAEDARSAVHAHGGAYFAVNTIVAGNAPSPGGERHPDSGSHNQMGGSAQLLPLGDYGGATQTMPPRPGSVDIGNGLCHDVNTTPGDGIPVKDQRGVARPQGAGCDIGAVEHIATFLLRGLGQNGQRALTGDVFGQPLVVQALDASGNPVVGVLPEVTVPASGASALCSASASDNTGIARVLCVANPVAGSYPVRISTPFGPNAPPMLVTYTLTNRPNDRIFGSGFGGTALPTTESLP